MVRGTLLALVPVLLLAVACDGGDPEAPSSSTTPMSNSTVPSGTSRGDPNCRADGIVMDVSGTDSSEALLENVEATHGNPVFRPDSGTFIPVTIRNNNSKQIVVRFRPVISLSYSHLIGVGGSRAVTGEARVEIEADDVVEVEVRLTRDDINAANGIRESLDTTQFTGFSTNLGPLSSKCANNVCLIDACSP